MPSRPRHRPASTRSSHGWSLSESTSASSRRRGAPRRRSSRSTRERHLAAPARRAPLFDPRWTRELLASLLATEVADGRLDEAAAIALIAAGRPLDPFPQLTRRSLRRGAQVLVDVGEGMEPFVDDAWDLVERDRADRRRGQRQYARVLGRATARPCARPRRLRAAIPADAGAGRDRCRDRRPVATDRAQPGDGVASRWRNGWQSAARR